jgi:hypothetical protein
MSRTPQQYLRVVEEARQLFVQKNADYGTAWRVLRPSSITDQIYIKAARIRSVDQKKDQKIGDSIATEFIGIINYCLMALILLKNEESEDRVQLTKENVIGFYDECVLKVYQLMLDKNHDYDEVWRDMRVSSMTDLILMKIVRIKEIEDKEGETRVSEGTDANFMDIMNYAIFALILINQQYNPNF